MDLHIPNALTDGFWRALQRNSWILIGTYLLVSLLQGGLVWMVATSVLPLGASPGASGGQMLDPGSQLPPLVSLPAVFIASLMGGFLTVPVMVIANRTLVSQFTENVPEEFVLHRLGWATINSFLGSWLVSIAVGSLTIILFGLGGWGLFTWADQATLGYLIGTWPGRALLIGTCLVLLFPSAYLGLGLIFVGQEVAVKDKNVISAVRGSWRLARYNRLRLFVLVLLLFTVQMILSFATFELLGPTSAQVVSLLETAIIQLIVIAIMARAYVQVCTTEEINQLDLYQKVRRKS